MKEQLVWIVREKAGDFQQALKVGLCCCAGWLLMMPLYEGYKATGFFTWAAFSLVLISVRIELPLLKLTPLTPVTLLIVGIFIRSGIGPLILAVSGNGGNAYLDVWLRNALQAQLLWIPLFIGLLIVGLLNKRYLPTTETANGVNIDIDDITEQAEKTKKERLILLALVLSLYMIFYIVLSGLSGAFDRQFLIYSNWANKLWRIDTPVAAFSRLKDIWFFLFPIWICVTKRLIRVLLFSILGLYAIVVIPSGSRGLLLYPALLMILGMWFLVKDKKRILSIVCAFVIIAASVSPIIVATRENALFRSATNIETKYQALVSVLSERKFMLAKTRWLGRDLTGCHDAFLFTENNLKRPRAEFKGLDTLPYILLPKHLFPKRPVIFDGHLIAKTLENAQESQWSRVWFPCITLPGDLYRRWGWIGVYIGSSLCALIIFVYIRLWCINVAGHGSTYAMLLYLYPSTYLQSFPFGTVSETCWSLFWEIPKYLIVFMILGKVIDMLVLRQRVKCD